MQNTSRMVLTLRAFWELLRYDVVAASCGFRGVHRGLRRVDTKQRRTAGRQEVCDAFECAASLYWKRAQCLQRSVALARLLRAYGYPAELVIGYRLAPFFSHAWVELEGRVVNGSSALPTKLNVLERA
jgi:Transglutaminase-like superfamily